MLCQPPVVQPRVSAAGFDVRVQLPLALDPDSEPEPDVAVVPGRLEDYLGAHPCGAVRVVEVADSSLPHDRSTKPRLYAVHDIGEYWIVNLPDAHIAAYRKPDEGEYRQRLIVRPGDSILAPGRPGTVIAAAELVP